MVDPTTPDSTPPAAPRRVSPPLAPSVQIADRIADSVGVVCITYLCVLGKVTGTEAMIAICALLGALQGLRALGIGKGAVGVVSLLLVLTTSAVITSVPDARAETVAHSVQRLR